MYYKFETIESVELEITNYCNAFCGDCDRNINGGKLRNIMFLKHMPLDTWYNVVTEENFKYIHTINFNGNYGESTMHPHFIKMLEHLVTIKPDLHILLSTNGGARTAQFWKDLADVLNRFKYHKVNFSVDGTEKTNHIYRRGVNWKNLTRNIKTFNDNNGVSTLSMIIFDYNKDEIVELANTAETLGCSLFQTRRNRSRKPIILDEYKNFPSGVITSPSIDTYYEKFAVKKIFKTYSYKYPYYKNPTDEICPFGSQGKISIDNTGNVWPCCFFYADAKNFNKGFDYEKYYNFNSLNENSLEYICNFFHEDLTTAWKQKSYKKCENCLHKYRPPVHPDSRKTLR